MIRIALFLILVSHLVLAQNTEILKYKNCEIIFGDTINCTVDGNKTGYWIIYEPRPIPTTEDTDPNIRDYYYFIAEGKYHEGIKTGLWKYYHFIKYGGHGQKQFINKTIIYNKAGFKDSIEIHYYDASTIKSNIHWSDGIIDSLEVFYPSGIIKSKAIFEENNVSEFWIFYPGGELKYYGADIDEFKIGKLKFFDAHGVALTPRTFMYPEISLYEGLLEYL